MFRKNLRKNVSRKNVEGEDLIFKTNAKLGIKDIFNASLNAQNIFFTLNPETYFVKTKDGATLKFYHFSDSDSLHAKGYIFAAVFNNDMEEDSYLIITDDLYDQIPQPLRKVIIDHEIAHLLEDNNVLKKSNYFYLLKRSFCTKDTLEREIRADEYAIEQNGIKKVMLCFRYMLENFELTKSTERELKLRLNHLKERQDKNAKRINSR